MQKEKVIGCMLRSRIVKNMIGKLAHINPDGTAIIVVDGTSLLTCLENWEVV